MSSPYLQLEFTAADDMARASDAECDSSEASAPHSPRRAGNIASPRSLWKDDRPAGLVLPTRAFFVALTLLIFVTSFGCRGITHGILRIMEEEADLAGSETLAISFTFDVGFVVVAVAVLSLQNRGLHRPKSIGFGGFLVGIGLLFASIPYVILRNELPNDKWYQSKYELCGAANSTDVPPNDDSLDSSYASIVWMVLGLIIAGTGAVPQFPMGITYVEDKFRGVATPFYLAILLSSYFLGIWCGQLLSYVMWTNVGTATSSTVVLWWLGYFCSALLALTLGLFIFMGKDPHKNLVKETTGARPRGGQGSQNSTQSQYRRLESGEDKQSKALRGVKSRHHRIFCNPVLLSVCAAGSCEVALITGFSIFLPKYLGTVSRIGNGPAKFFIETTVITSVCIGIMTSAGFILHKKIKSNGLCRLALASCVVALLFVWTLYMFRCSDPTIAGNRGKTGDPLMTSDGNPLDQSASDVVTCNDGCSCSKLPYNPVCGSNGMSYLSPCLAGCPTQHQSDVVDSQGLNLMNFTDCTCVVTSVNSTHVSSGLGYALSGPCPSDCSNEWPFVVIVFVVFVATGMQLSPLVLLSMRCVIRADRIASLSLGVIAWHVLGYIPAVAYFTAILNNACAVWKFPDAQHYHECALFDTNEHHTLFVTIALVLKLLSLALHVVPYAVTRNRRGPAVGSEWAEYDTIEMVPSSEENARASRL